jgi:hypothetical protein
MAGLLASSTRWFLCFSSWLPTPLTARLLAADLRNRHLDAWTKSAAGPAEQRRLVRQTLTYWRADADLAGVRDKESLAKLPEDERKAWQKLWADVADLLSKAQGK